MDFKAFLLAVTLLLGNYFDRKWQRKEKEHDKSNTHFVSGMLYENASYCPHIDTCMYKYNAELIDTSDSSRCCKPCQCENIYCEHMTCCPDIMPCTNPAAEQVNQRLVCIPTTLKRKSPEPGVLSIATCSAKNSRNEQKCQQEYDIINADINYITPVSDVNSHNTYRNIHCALCNGVDMDNIQYWLLNVSCEHDEHVNITEESTLLKWISKDDNCDISFNKPGPDINVKPCSFLIETCNVTGHWDLYNTEIEFKCRLTPERDIRYNKRSMFFKNSFCPLCNGIFGPKTVNVGSKEKPKFSILISIDAREDTTSWCEPGMVYQKSQELCVEARCSPLRQLRNNICERTIDTMEKVTYRMGFRLKPELTSNIEMGFKILPELTKQLTDGLKSVFELIFERDFEITLIADLNFHDSLDASEILQASLLWYEVHLRLLMWKSHDPEEKLEKLLSLSRNTKLQHGIPFQIILKDYLGYPSYKQLPPDLQQCSYRFTTIFPCVEFDPRITLRASYPGNVTAAPYIGRYKASGQPLSGTISSASNIFEFRKCPFIQVLKKNTVWKENHFGIEFVNPRFFLNSSEFLYGDNTDSIWICLETHEILFNSGKYYYPYAVFVMNAGMFLFYKQINMC